MQEYGHIGNILSTIGVETESSIVVVCVLWEHVVRVRFPALRRIIQKQGVYQRLVFVYT